MLFFRGFRNDFSSCSVKITEETTRRRRLQTYFSPGVGKMLGQQDEDDLAMGKESEVTVIISDIRGFTALSERLDSRETVKLLNLYHSKMVEAVFQHGGTLDKYLGDGLLAYFNAPIGQADHAERAVQPPPLSDLLSDALKDATPKANSCNTTASRAAIQPDRQKEIPLSRAPRWSPLGTQNATRCVFHPLQRDGRSPHNGCRLATLVRRGVSGRGRGASTSSLKNSSGPRGTPLSRRTSRQAPREAPVPRDATAVATGLGDGLHHRAVYG